MSTTNDSEAKTAKAALPAGAAWASVTDFFLRDGEEVSARWGDVAGKPKLTVHIGGLGLCLTTEQWQVVVDTANAVLPQAVTA